MRLAWLYALAIAVGGVLIVLFTGEETEVSATAECVGDPFVKGEEPPAPTASLFLVDYSRNDAEARETVAQVLRPTVSRAVAHGGTIRLVVSGGEGKPMRASPCLDGQTVFHSDWRNETREEKEQARAVELVEGNVAALLAETEVSRVGGTTDLLAEIPAQLRALRVPAEENGLVRVTLVSDLNSPASAGDCLRLDGVPASRRNAIAVVERCLRLRQFRPLPSEVSFTVVRPELTQRHGPASRMGRFIADALCAQMTVGGSGCSAPSELES